MLGIKNCLKEAGAGKTEKIASTFQEEFPKIAFKYNSIEQSEPFNDKIP